MSVPIDDDVSRVHANPGGSFPFHVWLSWGIWREHNHYISNRPDGRLHSVNWNGFSRGHVTDHKDYPDWKDGP